MINYNLGKDMVRRYIESRSGGDPGKRWAEFETAPVVAPAAVGTAVIADRLMSSKSGRVLLAAAILCVAGYVFVYATGTGEPAHQVRRVQLLRLPAILVHLRRLDARRRRAGLLWR